MTGEEYGRPFEKLQAAGAGNLLGNLLCAVTGLLDSPGGLARILNDIPAILA